MPRQSNATEPMRRCFGLVPQASTIHSGTIFVYTLSQNRNNNFRFRVIHRLHSASTNFPQQQRARGEHFRTQQTSNIELPRQPQINSASATTHFNHQLLQQLRIVRREVHLTLSTDSTTETTRRAQGQKPQCHRATGLDPLGTPSLLARCGPGFYIADIIGVIRH